MGISKRRIVMTTQAEAAAAATSIIPHVAKAQSAGSIPGHAPLLQSALGALSLIGTGGSVGANNSAQYTAWQTAVSQAAMRSISAGDAVSGVMLRNAAAVLGNLAAGV
jgi:hypothetical protein